MDTGPKSGSGYCTQLGQWILDPNWAVDTGPKLGSGYWNRFGQWILYPNWVVDIKPDLGSGYYVTHSVEISGFFCHSDFT